MVTSPSFGGEFAPPDPGVCMIDLGVFANGVSRHEGNFGITAGDSLRPL
jgi:hypothetical protein